MIDRPLNALLAITTPKASVSPQVVHGSVAGRLLAYRAPAGEGEPIEVEPRAGELGLAGRTIAASADDFGGTGRPDWLRRLGKRRSRLGRMVRLAHGAGLEREELVRLLAARLALLEEATWRDAAGAPVLVVSLGVGGSETLQRLLNAGLLLPHRVLVQRADEIILAEEVLVPDPAGPLPPVPVSWGKVLDPLARDGGRVPLPGSLP